MGDFDIVEQLSRVAMLGSAWVLYLLIGLSIISLAAVVERVIFLRKYASGAETLREQIRQALLANDVQRAEKVLADSPSIQARVLRAAWAWRVGGADSVADAVESELGKVRGEIDRGGTLLGTIGNNAPFIGLFGTVVGVIQAFQFLGDSNAGDSNMGNVMKGIAEALIATGVGIFVAIPSVIAFNVIQKRAGDIEGDVQSIARLFGAWLKTPAGLEAARTSAAPVAESARPEQR